MTVTAWEGYFATYMERLRSAFPTKELCHNSLWFAGGAQSYNNPRVIREIQASDVINMERGYSDSGITGGTGTGLHLFFILYLNF